MLTINPSHYYCVYPSWADLGIAWEDLQDLLDHPLRHEKELDINAINWLKQTGRYPPKMPPYRLWDGPAGGGVIFTDETGRGMFSPSLFDFVSRTMMGTLPQGQSRAKPDMPSVLMLEARGDLWIILGRKITRKPYCPVRVERFNAASEAVYWAIDYSMRKTPLKGLHLLSEFAPAFGLSVELADHVPEAVAEESGSCLPEPGRQRMWFRIIGGGNDAGFHFAVMLYMACHLRVVAGKNLQLMSLVAQIEMATAPEIVS